MSLAPHAAPELPAIEKCADRWVHRRTSGIFVEDHYRRKRCAHRAEMLDCNSCSRAMKQRQPQQRQGAEEAPWNFTAQPVRATRLNAARTETLCSDVRP